MSSITPKVKFLQVGNVIINAGYTNTIITITDLQGHVFYWESGGSAGFLGTRKSSPLAAQRAALLITRKAIKFSQLTFIHIKLIGYSTNRTLILRTLYTSGLKFLSLIELHKLPTNGCRPLQRKRL